MPKRHSRREEITTTVSFVRTYASKGKDDFRLSISDDKSGTTIVEVRIPADKIGDLLSTRDIRDIPATFFGGELVGCTSENKTEFVPFDKYNATPEEEHEALLPFLVEGWFPRGGDLENSHRTVIKDGVTGQSVVFFRYINPDGTFVVQD